MIRYDLRCVAGHDFDGWFQDSAGFDRLAQASLLECPACGGSTVSKRLMTPAVARTPGVKGRLPATERLPAGSGPAPSPPKQPVSGGLPPQMLAMLQRMRAEVESRCDYVGRDFAAEARRIHEGESERDGIYGEATEAEVESLADDGIEIGRMPWVPRADG